MKYTVIDSPLPMGKHSDVVSLHYDGHLAIIIDPGHEGDAQIEVLFDTPQGFRCVDEGNLSYWDDPELVENWFFEITDGGWLRSEHGGQFGIASTTPAMREFLICSSNDCVSVLSPKPPTLRIVNIKANKTSLPTGMNPTTSTPTALPLPGGRTSAFGPENQELCV